MGTHLSLRPEEAEKGKTERLPRPEETGINRMSAEAGRNGKRDTGAPRIPNGNGRNGFREKDREREKKDGAPLRKNSGRNSVPVSEKETGGNRRPLRRDYLYFGSMSPWALIRSSHMAMILSMLSSAAVWGSSMAA